MKQSLSIKLGQQLKMTPQLQQAIRLLQLSTLELEQEIQDSIDANPMLETEDDWADSPDNESAVCVYATVLLHPLNTPTLTRR